MASNLEAMASNLLAIASNLLVMASNLLAMASNLLAMASNLLAMASSSTFFSESPLEEVTAWHVSTLISPRPEELLGDRVLCRIRIQPRKGRTRFVEKPWENTPKNNIEFLVAAGVPLADLPKLSKMPPKLPRPKRCQTPKT